MTVDDVFRYYSSEFLPAYARAVAELQDKPVQITVEIENAFSHLAVASNHSKAGNKERQAEHIKKSLGHIERATLDAYKFIWLSLLKKCRIFDRPGILEFATKDDYDKSILLHEEFKQKATEARVRELSNLEETVSIRNKFYHDAIEAADALFLNLDPKKLKKFKSHSMWYIIKTNAVSFSLGVVAGITGNLLTDFIKSK